MAHTATPRTLLATAASAALVVGLAACGGDDDAAEVATPNTPAATIPDVTFPDVTIPDLDTVTVPDLELPGGTLPGGVTVPDMSDISIPEMPDISIPDLPSITLPGGMTFDELIESVPEFSGEGSAEFCAAVARLDDFEEIEADTPEEVKAAIPVARELYENLSDAAPAELAPYVDLLVDQLQAAVSMLEVNGYDPDAVDFDAMALAEPGLMQASMAIGAYTNEFCEP